MRKKTSALVSPYTSVFKSVVESPGFLDRMFAHIANGGDLITLSENGKIKYSDLANWINADNDRIKIYSAARKMGDEWVRQRILNEIASIATVDIRRLLNEDGSVKPSSEWPSDAAKAIIGIEVVHLYDGNGSDREKVGTVRKIKLLDKTRALELIGRQFGMFVQKHAVKVTRTLEDILEESYEDEARQSGLNEGIKAYGKYRELNP